MSGHRWDPVIRVVPFNASEVVYWFSDLLTDIGAPTKIRIRPVLDQSTDLDINREKVQRIWGLWLEVDIDVVVLSMSDQHFLADIESALMSPRSYAVFLSLDGGVTYRQVILPDAVEAAPLAGKTIIGSTFTLSLHLKKSIPERPKMMLDPGVGAEILNDPSVDLWTGGQPDEWTGTAAGIATVSRELGITLSGPAARVTRAAASTPPDGTSFFAFTQKNVGLRGPNAVGRLNPGSWYRYRGSVYGVGFTNPGMRVQIFNVDRQVGVNSDGKTWGSTDLIPSGTILNGAWASFEAYFRVPQTFGPTETIVARMAGYFGASNAVIYDEFSVYGPVLRPGVATW